MKSAVAALSLGSWALLGFEVAAAQGVAEVAPPRAEEAQPASQETQPASQQTQPAAPETKPAPVGADLVVPGVFSQPKPQGVADFQAMQAHQRRLAAELRRATCTVLLDGGTGSAEFISPEGLMASAAHVTMEPGTEFTVVLADGRELQAVALTADTQLDGSFAMVLPGQLEEPLPYLALAKLGEFKAGDWCMVCGNSGGWDAQRGSVIRVGRLVRATPEEIQTDTTLIGGDSGGPLVDLHGRFLGSNSRVGSTARFTLHVPLDYYLEWLPVALEQQQIVLRDGVEGLRKSLAGPVKGEDANSSEQSAHEPATEAESGGEAAGDSGADDSQVEGSGAGNEAESTEATEPDAGKQEAEQGGTTNGVERGEASDAAALRGSAKPQEVL